MAIQLTAWEAIGWEGMDGIFKIVGGRAEYDAVIYNDGHKLVRLVRGNHTWPPPSRYIDPDTLIECDEDSFRRFCDSNRRDDLLEKYLTPKE